MKKLQKRKGFTLTELAIVIAVIAILIAVLVPTFVTLLNRAENSSDEQTVKNLNTALSVDEAENGTPETICVVWDILEEAGYNPAPTPNYSENEFYWYQAVNRIVIVSGNKIVFPEEYSGITVIDEAASQASENNVALCSAKAKASSTVTEVSTDDLMDLSIGTDSPYAHHFDSNGKCTNCKNAVEYSQGTISDGKLTAINSGITELVIPDSVTEINNNLCKDNTSLTSVVIGDNLTSISQMAFMSCTSLTDVTIGSGVTTIAKSAFNGCTSLTSVTFSEDSELTMLYGMAFKDCTSLTSVTLPEDLTSIGDITDDNGGGSTFKGCTSLTYIYIPDSVTAIAKNSFDGCSSLTSITLPSGLTAINGYTFNGCTSLTSISIPDNVTIIGNAAFKNCTSLASISFGNDSKLTSFYSEAFSTCTSLTSITITNNVTTITMSAFYGCSSLTSVTFKDTAGWKHGGYVAPGSTELTSDDLSNTTTAAQYLTSTYVNDNWFKTSST